MRSRRSEQALHALHFMLWILSTSACSCNMLQPHFQKSNQKAFVAGVHQFQQKLVQGGLHTNLRVLASATTALRVHWDMLGLKGAEPCPRRVLSRVHAHHQPLHVQTRQPNISKDKFPLGEAMQRIQTPQSISKLHF